MSRRVQVLGAIWLVVLAIQSFEPLTRCLLEVGPDRALWLVRARLAGWSASATVVVGVVAVIWYVGWPERPTTDPGEPGTPVPPPPA